MFTKKVPNTNPDLNVPMNNLLPHIAAAKPDSDEYVKMVDQLVKLHKMRECEKSSPVSNDTLAIVAGNLLIVLVVVAFESKHVITTKALSFVQKMR